MNSKKLIGGLAWVVFCFGGLSPLGATDNVNEPECCKDNSCSYPEKCDCSGSQDDCECRSGNGGASAGSINFSIEVPGFADGDQWRSGSLRFWHKEPSVTMFTLQGLDYISPAGAYLSQTQGSFESNRRVTLTVANRHGQARAYVVANGSSAGVAVDSAVRKVHELKLLDAARNPIADQTPTYVRLENKNTGSSILLDYATGEAIEQVDAFGRVSTFGSMDIVRQEGVITQIASPGGLIDFHVIDADYEYEIRFYETADYTYNATTDRYVLNADVNAVTDATKRFNVLNPARSSQDIDETVITRYWDSRVTQWKFQYFANNDLWKLRIGELASGTFTLLRREEAQLVESQNGRTRTDIKRVHSGANKLLSEVIEKSERIAGAFRLVERTLDPSGANLITRYAHYASGTKAGKTKYVKHPDGSWRLYDYDSNGRKILEVESWLDVPLNESWTPSQMAVLAKATKYSYAPVDSKDDGSIQPDSPRTETVRILGAVSSRSWKAYYRKTNGEQFEVSERAATQSASYGAAANLRSETIYYRTVANGETALRAGRLKKRTQESGAIQEYDYSKNSAGNLVVTETQRHADATGPVAYKTTRHKKTYDASANLIRDEMLVYDGSAYQSIYHHTHTYDADRNRTQSRRYDGLSAGRITYSATYSHGKATSESDEVGRTVNTSYDILDRKELEITLGSTAAGVGEIHRLYTYTTSATGCGCTAASVLVQSADGSLSRTEINETDRVKRPTRSVDANGLETRYAYIGGTTLTNSGPNQRPTVQIFLSLQRILLSYPDGRTAGIAWWLSGSRLGLGILGVSVKLVSQGIAHIVTNPSEGTVHKKVPGWGIVSLWNLPGLSIFRIPAVGSVTTTAAANSVTTQTNPNGATHIRTNYLDGRLKSITGTAVIAQYYSYGVNPDGSAWSRIDTADGSAQGKTTLSSAPNLRYQKETYDPLGRLIQTEAPAATGGVIRSAYTYDSRSRLSSQSQPGQPKTHYLYDNHGQLRRSGLDLNADGQLTLASNDRITDSARSYSLQNNAWFELSTTKLYPDANNATSLTVSTRKRRLNGYTGARASETTTLDVHGNKTVQTTEVNRTTKTLTHTTNTPNSTTNAVRITINGYLKEANSPTVATRRTYGYDALGRLTSIRDPRHTASQTIAYRSGSLQVATQTDAAGNATSYAYHANGVTGAGQLKTLTNALSQTTHYTYDLHGRPTRIWGGATYPQAYSYNKYGELASLTTWRDAANAIDFSASAWPNPAAATGDTTTWTYAAATGLLTRKQYPDSNGTDYSYDSANRLSTRKWARLDSQSNPLKTTYRYSALTGERTTVDYADATTDISYTYDRIGRLKTVTDAAGSRTFAYNTKLQLASETIATFYGVGKRLTPSYQSGTTGANLQGRYHGFEVGTAADPDADYKASYAFDPQGRLNSLTAHNQRYTYTYAANSNLLASQASPAHTTSYTYETNRDLKTRVQNGTHSTYSYRYDAIGRRTDRAQSGSAFTQTSFDAFTYNPRSEVTGSRGYRGTTPTDKSRPLAADAFDYTYDPIGNRLSSSAAGVRKTYTSNALNQYLTAGTKTLTHDADGNLTSDLPAAGRRGRNFTWTAENRLKSIQPITKTTGAKKVEFKYDYRGRRIQKTVSRWNGSAYTIASNEKFLYNGWNLIAVYNAASNHTLLKTHTWGLDLSRSLQGAGGVGGLLGVKEHSGIHAGTYHFTYDANGNVAQVLKQSTTSASAATRVAHYVYGPYGQTRYTGPYANANPFRFSTKYLDRETTLYYYGFRYYDPVTGRWPSRDPMEEEGGLNLYAFAYNNGINWIDLYGLCTRGEIKLKGVSVETTTLLGLSYTAKDPANYVRGYLESIAEDKIKEAADKESKFIKWMNGVMNSSQSIAKSFGLWAEWYSTAGLIIDKVTVAIDYECCVCDEDTGENKFVKKSASDRQSNLNIQIRTGKNLDTLPDTYVDGMLGVAQKMAKGCPNKN